MASVQVSSAVYPSLHYQNALAAIDWLHQAFGFEPRLLVRGPENSVEHSELSMGDAVVMVGGSRPEFGLCSPRQLNGQSTHVLSVYVDDPDAHYARAVRHGAEIVRPLRDEEYGARGYMARDLEGHLWYFGNYRPGSFWEAPTAHPENAAD